MNLNTINSNVTPQQLQSSYSGGVEVKAIGQKNYTDNERTSNDTKNAQEESFINAIEKANHIQQGTTECQFSIHQETKQIMIKLVDVNTHQVVKEIPSEKILDMVAKMCDLAGVFVDAKR